MPASMPPMILADNVFDRINLYSAGILSSTNAVVGREVNYVADYRRERTYFQASLDQVNNRVAVDLGAGNSSVIDSIFLDRGHNLWGYTIQVLSSDDNFDTVPNFISATVPAGGTVGGDPTAGWAVTEEGALYWFFAAFPLRRYHQFRVIESMAPIVTGAILGKRTQLLNYSSVLDEDAGERSDRQENSLIPGYYGRDRTYSTRTLNVQLATIGAAEYDAQIRTMRRVLFEKDQPAFIVMNYGTKPERGWLYQYQGNRWSAPTDRTLRRHSFQMVELGPLIR